MYDMRQRILTNCLHSHGVAVFVCSTDAGFRSGFVVIVIEVFFIFLDDIAIAQARGLSIIVFQLSRVFKDDVELDHVPMRNELGKERSGTYM
jgi:hypothetical protein